MSQFEKLNDEALKLLLEQIIEEFENEDVQYNEINLLEYLIEDDEIVLNIGRYFGVTQVDFDDISFIAELININPFYFYETYPLKRPTKKVFKVVHSEDYMARGTKYYVQNIDSYSDVNDDVMWALRTNDMYNWWEGDEIKDVVDTYETRDDYIERIERIQ